MLVLLVLIVAATWFVYKTYNAAGLHPHGKPVATSSPAVPGSQNTETPASTDTP